MKRNKTRNIKFALATTLAFIFMIAMSVTSLAEITLSIEPTPNSPLVRVDGENHIIGLSVDVHVDVAGEGFTNLFFAPGWDPAQLVAQRPGGNRTIALFMTPLAIANQFETSPANARLIDEGSPFLEILGQLVDPTPIFTESGVVARMQFDVVLPVDATGPVTISLENDGTSFGPAPGGGITAIPDPIIGTPNLTLDAVNLLWGYYNAGGDDQTFIRHALDDVQNVGWVNHFYGQVVPAARAATDNPYLTGPEAFEYFLDWAYYDEHSRPRVRG